MTKPSADALSEEQGLLIEIDAAEDEEREDSLLVQRMQYAAGAEEASGALVQRLSAYSSFSHVCTSPAINLRDFERTTKGETKSDPGALPRRTSNQSLHVRRNDCNVSTISFPSKIFFAPSCCP